MERYLRWPILLTALVAMAVLVLGAACGDDDDDNGGPNPTATNSGETMEPGQGTDVGVTLRPWSISLDMDTVPVGTVKFSVTNDGSDYEHEFVIVKTDLAPGDLPTNDDGTVNEDSSELTSAGEVEVPVGETDSFSVDLDAGHYVAFCNLTVPDDAGELAGKSHYELGMRTEFTVQ